MLRVEKLTYEVKGRKLLKDVSFQLRKGEVVALLGANGAGKSTLMKLLSGEQKAQSGTVTLYGKPLSGYDARELSKCRAMLTQQQHISLAFTVREIVMMGRYPHFRTTPTICDKEVVEEVMKLCGVSDFTDRIFLSLSGGEQQRVQLARILAQIWDNPDSLLLLDEPISALDLHYQQKVLAIAKALSRRGMMVVLVVHDVNFAAMYADRILMLKHGRKLFDGSPVEVLNTKDIYTIFSVEATVELNTKTLKPHVHLEEMGMDADIFPVPSLQHEGSLTLEQRRALLMRKCPYLSVEEQAVHLGISEIEALLLTTGQAHYHIQESFQNLQSHLLMLGKVRVCTKSGGCRHTRIATYTDIDLKLLWNTWYIGVMVEEDKERSLHFFNKSGREIHAIYLIDGESHIEAFETIKQTFATRQQCTLAIEPLPLENPIEQSNGMLLDNFAERTGVQRIKRIDAAFVRKVLHTSADKQLSIRIVVSNSSGTQGYTGYITNLIDQGDRYFIKDTSFVLEIEWARIRDIWTVRQYRDGGDIYGVEVYDTEDNLILQLYGPGNTLERDVWRDLIMSNSVTI
ncbi:heme ABC transporter ATP-binding protein [Sphingobacterium sp. SGG-5]|uniref:heme ABC transporter ATP-binding protein n=1 Tax=Sphingobacterium sp. SGG-5 TaxID=2710881 RepID=UPI0013EB5796|nr:heme ABC transporter ATP-binding protein [Sphingobacterium sp. SGG-5]NGM62217.1 heme ABC transporter ATP-binding protein [Sphingobacterium sp. SGG-5]